MKKTRGFLLAAGVSLALAFTFGCSGDDGDESGGDGGSSSSIAQSNSSIGDSCASFVEGTEREHYGKMKKLFCDERDSKEYVYVVIGTQTWMAENLNYAVEGSKCYNDDPNCEKYGRFYDWSTAMDLPSSCNSTSCSSQIMSPHRGICPEGWHIPSNADWDKLYRFADGTNGTSSPYESPTAGEHLKAKLGWNSYSGIENLDTYEFSALPGGLGYSDGYFYYVGDYGYWWSSSEDLIYSAYTRYMLYSYESARWYNFVKSFLFSVRCLQD